MAMCWLPSGWWALTIVEAVWLLLAVLTLEGFYLTLAWLSLYVALAGLAAWGWASMLLRNNAPRHHRVLAVLTVGFTWVVVIQIVLSLAGRLCLEWELGAWGLAAVSGWALGRRARRKPAPEAGCPRRLSAMTVVGTAVLAVSVAGQMRGLVIRLSLPPENRDDLSYHLFFPGRWIQEQRVTIEPKPFGPEYMSYFPLDAELVNLWLMLPMRDHLLAKVSQWPFFLWLAAALWAVARQMAVPRALAWFGPALVLTTWTIAAQALSANTDVTAAALVATAVAFMLRLRRRRSLGDALLAGLAGGLVLGSKLNAALYYPLVWLPTVWLLARRRRRGAGRWACLAVFVVGLAVPSAYWYGRNWMLTGNPVFPSDLRWFGITLFPGAELDYRAMREGGWSSDDPLSVLSMAYGDVHLWMALAGTVLGLTWWGWRRRRRWLEGYVLALAPVIFALFWTLIAYNREGRYAWPGLVLAYVGLPYAAACLRPWGWTLGLATVAAWGWTAWVAVPPFSAKGMLAGVWNVPMAGPIAFGALAAGLGLFVWAVGFGQGRPARLVGAVGLAMAMSAAVWGLPDFEFHKTLSSERFDATFFFARPGPDNPNWPLRRDQQAAWRFINQQLQARGATIAYAGLNIPYFFLGPRYTNAVRYINVNRHPDWLLHDYVADLRRRGIPVRRIADRSLADRRELEAQAWYANLAARGVELVVISKIHEGEYRHFVDQMEDGFPIEYRWIREKLGAGWFQPLLTTEHVHVYRWTGPAAPTSR